MSEKPTVKSGVINEAKELYDRLIIRAEKVDAELATALDKKQKSDKLIEYNENLKKELDERSEKISNIEDAITLKAEVSKGVTELNAAKKKFKNEQAKIEEENKKTIDENSEIKSANQSRSDKLIKAELALDEDKKNYKQKIMKEINDNIEKQKVK